jgi:hypothetical protein
MIKSMKMSGWGNYPVISSQVYRPEKISALESIINQYSVIAHGSGRSYSNWALKIEDFESSVRLRIFNFGKWIKKSYVISNTNRN